MACWWWVGGEDRSGAEIVTVNAATPPLCLRIFAPGHIRGIVMQRLNSKFV